MLQLLLSLIESERLMQKKSSTSELGGEALDTGLEEV